VAQNATHVQHNILTIRGALVRDARAWSAYLTETIAWWGGRAGRGVRLPSLADVGARAVEFLALQRDLYGYLHDQTLRMINQGYTGDEIAELFEFPPKLRDAWHTNGYYGSASHNARAVYQRYIGFYDANPAPLWPHPPVESGKRYVSAIGGADAAVAQARRAFEEGDYRWAAEVLNHVLFADERHADARALQADTLRAARLRRAERHLAQRLSRRRLRAAPRQLRHAGHRGLPGSCQRAHSRAAARQRRHPDRRPPGLETSTCASTSR
jgi:alkyl sulfatase BDS1-like metallo-beta-lactamase superfamily hydrolase